MRAQVWKAPPETSTALAMPLTATGVFDPFVVPLPSWPSVFLPQHCTVWSERSAHVWK